MRLPRLSAPTSCLWSAALVIFTAVAVTAPAMANSIDWTELACDDAREGDPCSIGGTTPPRGVCKPSVCCYPDYIHEQGDRQKCTPCLKCDDPEGGGPDSWAEAEELPSPRLVPTQDTRSLDREPPTGSGDSRGSCGSGVADDLLSGSFSFLVGLGLLGLARRPDR